MCDADQLLRSHMSFGMCRIQNDIVSPKLSVHSRQRNGANSTDSSAPAVNHVCAINERLRCLRSQRERVELRQHGKLGGVPSTP